MTQKQMMLAAAMVSSLALNSAVFAQEAHGRSAHHGTEDDSSSMAERGPHLGHAWVRPPLGGRDITAGYGRLHNPTATDDRLLAISSPLVQAIELHASEDDGEVVRMVKRDVIDSPADSHVEFEPGGLHMMLFGVPQGLTEGDEVPLVLTFEQAGEVEAIAVVAQSQPEDHDPHGHH